MQHEARQWLTVSSAIVGYCAIVALSLAARWPGLQAVILCVLVIIAFVVE